MIVFEKESAASSEPKMTLLILFYNQRRYVRESVEHALAQTYPNCELVFSDDGSTDGTAEAILEIVEKYKGSHGIKVNVNRTNLGFGRHFSVVAPLCTGQWVVTQGGDDFSDVDRLKVLSARIKEFPGVQAISSSAVGIDMEGAQVGLMINMVSRPIVYPKYSGGRFTVSHIPEDPDRLSLAQTLGATAAYLNSTVNLPSFPDDVEDEDLFLSLRAVTRGSVVYVPDRIVYRRVNPDSLSDYKKSAARRRLRRIKRLKISRMRYLAFRAMAREIGPGLRGTGFQETLEREMAVNLLQCFHEKMNSEGLGVYFRAFKTVVGEKGFFKAAETAFGRGKGAAFLQLAFLYALKGGRADDQVS